MCTFITRNVIIVMQGGGCAPLDMLRILVDLVCVQSYAACVFTSNTTTKRLNIHTLISSNTRRGGCAPLGMLRILVDLAGMPRWRESSSESQPEINEQQQRGKG